MSNETPLKKYFSYYGTPSPDKTFYVVDEHEITTFKVNGLKEDFLSWIFTAQTQPYTAIHSFPINDTTVLKEVHKNNNLKSRTSGGLCVLKTGIHLHTFCVNENMDDFITDIGKAANTDLRRKKIHHLEPKEP